MAVLVAIIAGVGLGLLYSRRGLFLAAITLVAAFLSIMTALGFGATVVQTVGVQSDTPTEPPCSRLRRSCSS